MKHLSKVIAAAVVMGSSSIAFANDEAMKTDEAAWKKTCEEMMAEADTNKDGKLSKEEFLAEKTKMFSKYDKDSDGMLSKDEHMMMGKDMHKMMMGDKSM